VVAIETCLCTTHLKKRQYIMEEINDCGTVAGLHDSLNAIRDADQAQRRASQMAFREPGKQH
jgi:hypothetical protein